MGVDDLPGGGIEPIAVMGGDVTLAAGAELTIGLRGNSLVGTWPLMSWTGDIFDNGLIFSGLVDQNVWSYNIDPTLKQMTVTAIPEPSAYALGGGLGALLGIWLIKRVRGQTAACSQAKPVATRP